MKMQNIQFYLLLLLINTAFGVETLVFQDLNSVFTSPGSQWNLNVVTQCQTTDFTEFSNQSAVGFFGISQSYSTKIYQPFPPHWSMSVRLDLILYQSLDPNDLIKVEMNTYKDGYTRETCCSGENICINNNTPYGDKLVLFYRNFTHSDSQLNITISSKQDTELPDEGFGFRNIYIFVDTCHDSCLTCNGPSANQCLTCPPNSTQNGNTCVCNSGYQALSNSCIQTCQTGFIQDSSGKLCVQDFCYNLKCQTCQSGLCTQCKPGYFLLNGQCVASCPSYSTLSGQTCIDIASLNSYRNYLLKSMFNTFFSESEINGAGISAYGFLGFISSNSRALTTVCNGNTLLGGAYLSSKNSYIQTKFTAVLPHWQVTIGYTLYKIDSWNNESVQLIVDGNVKVTTTKNASDGSTNLCGRVSQKDQIIQIQQNFAHSSPSLLLQIKSNLNSDPFTESYGIRELFVLVDYCSPNCLSCNASGCTQCQANYFMINLKCDTACPIGYISDSNNICQPCDSSCNTCSQPLSSTSCLSCKPNTYLNPNQTCQNTCPTQYWGNNANWQCQACDSTCYTCQSPGDSNSCTKCAGYLYLQLNKCIAACPSNAFPNKQTNNNICQLCDLSCNTCDGPNNNNCLSCLAPSSFYQQSSKTCVSTCNSNQYKNTANQTCSSCHQSCTTCSGPSSSNCLSCSGNTFLYQGQCITNCPVKFFNNATNNSCTPCDITCYTCTNVNPNNCLSCQLPNYFDPTSNKCLTTCNTGYYADQSLVSCKQCHSSCLTCSGPLQSNCLSCNTGLFLQNNQCKLSCDISYYVQNLTNICLPCNSSCKTCDGPNNNNCLSCQAPNFYQQSLKTCVNQCNSNQFQDTINQICSPCDSSCWTCQGPSNINCLSCTGNAFLYSNQCVQNCPLKYFNNSSSSNKLCTMCDLTCFTCSGSAQNQCLSCKLPRYFNPTNNQCVLACDSNQYADANSAQCNLCDSSCQTCNGPLPSNCISCASGLFLQNNYCKSSCDGSYFGDNQTNTCQQCDQSCKTCNGPNSNQCLSCQAPQLFYQSSSKTCVANCNLNQYKDQTNSICSLCNQTCSTCFGPSSTNCLSCSGNNFLFQNQCISNCPLNYFNNLQNNRCTGCDPTCYTCNGATSNNCLTCQLPKYFDPTTSQCVLTCNSNQYADNNSASCKQCDNSCLTCNGPLKSNCTNCASGLFLQNNFCKQICDGSYFGQSLTNTCQLCNQSCFKCNGPNNYNCLSCLAPNLFFQQNTCVAQCNQNQFKDLNSQICSPCDSSCNSCSGPSNINCLSCTGNLFFFQNQCIQNCPLTYFNNFSNNQCTQCDSTCFTCNGGAQNNCLTCQLPRYFDPTTNQCVLTCNTNQYPENSSISCKLCDSSCLTCDGPSAFNCKSCRQGLLFQNKQCKQACDAFYYLEVLTSTCKSCDQSCKTCDGPNSNNCLSCQSTLFYQQNTKTCTSQCNLNQYFDTSSKTCTYCHPSCASCSGPNDINCLTCSGNKFLYQNQCISNCPVKYYGNIQNKQCAPCDPTCYTCNGNALNNCLSCQLDRYLDPTTNQCVQNCNPNQYPDTNSVTCKQCDSSCLTCYGPSAQNCKSCKQGEFLQNNQCKSTCDDYYFVLPQTNTCQQCHPTCKKCSGSSLDDCLSSCAPNQISLKNSCVTDCPENYYSDQSQQIKECKECHSICKSGCIGPLKQDCDSIKYQYQIILYILCVKSLLWVISSIIGYIQDKKQSKVYNRIMDQPQAIESDRASQEYKDQIQFYKTDVQSSPSKTKMLQTFSQELQEQQQPNQEQITQVETKLNINTKTNVKRRPRKLTHKNIFYQKSLQTELGSQINIQPNMQSIIKSTSLFTPNASNMAGTLHTKDQKEQHTQNTINLEPKKESYAAVNILRFTIVIFLILSKLSKELIPIVQQQ